MKRYTFTAVWNEEQRETMAGMEESENGNWIKYDDYLAESEKLSNSGYPLLADVLAEIDESVGLRYGYANWRVAVELVLSKYFS
jgi:hypothetical protein